MVFCHNDILPLNILKTLSNGVKLIDFEYCGFNSYLCDIYNFLIEITYLTGEEYPNGF
jgi:thiamine kinase-like enzyme